MFSDSDHINIYTDVLNYTAMKYNSRTTLIDAISGYYPNNYFYIGVCLRDQHLYNSRDRPCLICEIWVSGWMWDSESDNVAIKEDMVIHLMNCTYNSVAVGEEDNNTTQHTRVWYNTFNFSPHSGHLWWLSHPSWES